MGYLAEYDSFENIGSIHTVYRINWLRLRFFVIMDFEMIWFTFELSIVNSTG